jgi:DNA-binding PadR family transcriptional regulator
MQRRGWLTSKWGRSDNNRKARFYSLTAKGRKQLAKATDSWTRFSKAVTKAMKPT